MQTDYGWSEWTSTDSDLSEREKNNMDSGNRKASSFNTSHHAKKLRIGKYLESVLQELPGKSTNLGDGPFQVFYITGGSELV